MKFIKTNWQAVVFAVVGFYCLYRLHDFLNRDKVTEAGVVFGIAFLSFLYANVSRFKRFKGLGFEAELWEDKQKEANDLIARLKNVVSIYTSQIVMSKVMEGRFADGNRWKDTWALYEELIGQHRELGQEIDFTNLKREMDFHFLFDMCSERFGIFNELQVAYGKAQANIRKEFGERSRDIKDVDGHKARLAQLNQVSTYLPPGLLNIARRENLAAWLLQFAERNTEILKRHFEVEVDFNPDELERLRRISHLWNNQPVPVNDETLDLAKHR